MQRLSDLRDLGSSSVHGHWITFPFGAELLAGVIKSELSGVLLLAVEASGAVACGLTGVVFTAVTSLFCTSVGVVEGVGGG